MGGVTAANMSDYFGAGASAVAFGGSVFRSDWLAAGEFGLIQSEIRTLVDAYRRARAHPSPESGPRRVAPVFAAVAKPR